MMNTFLNSNQNVGNHAYLLHDLSHVKSLHNCLFFSNFPHILKAYCILYINFSCIVQHAIQVVDLQNSMRFFLPCETQNLHFKTCVSRYHHQTDLFLNFMKLL